MSLKRQKCHFGSRPASPVCRDKQTVSESLRAQSQIADSHYLFRMEGHVRDESVIGTKADVRRPLQVYDGVDAPPTASMCQSGGVEHHLREASVSEVIIIGLDIAKHVFHAYGATGSEELNEPIVPRARIYDLVPVRELPYGPAALSLHQRPDRWQHPTTCRYSSKTACISRGVHSWVHALASLEHPTRPKIVQPSHAQGDAVFELPQARWGSR
jgi:hypothetical protein